MTSVRKTLKRWSDQHKTGQFLAKFALKITTKAAVFLPIFFRPSLPHFSAILSLKILRNLTFFPRPIRSPVFKKVMGSVGGEG